MFTSNLWGGGAVLLFQNLLCTGKQIGATVLFFGCRRADEDFIYEEELKGFVDKKVLSDLVTAFSREQTQKVYVQHKMKEESQLIWNVLENQGYIYVCGYVYLQGCFHGCENMLWHCIIIYIASTMCT